MTTSNRAGDQGQPRRRSLIRPATWRSEFPYHWDSDELVTRRQLLRLSVMASGALFTVTAGIVGLGIFRPVGARGPTLPITNIDNVPRGGVHYFAYPNVDDQAILLHLNDDSFVAYSGKCTHLSCAVYYNTENETLHCPCHEGYFDLRTGEVIAGPPQRPLPRISISQNGNMLYAIEVKPQ